ncbi:hypothetical protein [Streptomyces sp. NBC_00035]
MIIAVHFAVTVAITFLATVRWVRFGSDEPAAYAQPEPRRPSWAQP